MKPRVQQKLESIFGYPIFESVGMHLPDSVAHVTNWRSVAKECSSKKWGNCQYMARNAVQRGVEKQYPKPGMWEGLQEWNPLSEEATPLINSFIDTLLPRVPLPDESKEKIKHSLQYDFFYILLECELSDVSEPIFFLKHLEPWYAAGHFPCGWDGEEFPEGWDGIIRGGRLMVY